MNLVSGNPDDRDPLDVVAEEFAARCRRGENPSISDYVRRHPDIAEELKDLLPTVAAMEKAKQGRAPAQTPAPAAKIPERIGDYRIVRELGRGGMGVVYEAEQESLRRRVALKLLPQQFLSQAKRLERFRREARAAANLHHTNIVPVFGVGEDAGYSYYVMQLIEGRGLDKVIRSLRTGKAKRETLDEFPATATVTSLNNAAAKQARPSGASQNPAVIFINDDASSHTFPPSTTSTSQLHPSGGNYFRDVAELGRQIASALAYAHEQGTLHRDIKPANILLDRSGVAWLTDFGLAKLTEDEDLTKTGDLIGTLHYMAPEVLQQGQTDARSDVYSLGLTLYEALTLRLPFTETQPARIVKQITESTPPRLREVNAQVPPDLETIVMTAIAREPKHRYATALALADDLSAFMDGRPIRARRMTSLELGWRWCLRNRLTASLIATAAASLLLASVVGWVGYASAKSSLNQALAEKQRADENVDLSLQSLESIFQQLAADDSTARHEPLSQTAKETRAASEAEEGGFERGRPPRENGPPSRAQQDERANAERDAAQAALLGIILDFYEQFAEMNRADAKLHTQAIAAYRRIGDLYRRRREAGKVEERIARVIAKLEEAAALTNADQATRYALADLYLIVGSSSDVEKDAAQLGVVVPRLRKAEALAHQLIAESPDNAEFAILLARATGQLALTEARHAGAGAAHRFEQLNKLLWNLVPQSPPSLDELADLRLVYAENLCRESRWSDAKTFLEKSERDLDGRARELRAAATGDSTLDLRPSRDFHDYMVAHFKLLADVCTKLGDPEASHYRERARQGPPTSSDGPPVGPPTRLFGPPPGKRGPRF